LPDGAYRAGFRPNHLRLDAHGGDAVAFRCTLGIAEITGSETFLHLQHDDQKWVALVHGVHHFDAGSEVELWLDPAYVYLFDAEGRLAMPAAYAEAA
jgi:glycerol transport system ATP-binding protein